jgi:hypothetical protein
MIHDEIRKLHFERLNNYRQSAEYTEYSWAIGAPVLDEKLPSLIGNRWEIDAETYWEFLEVLPPLGWRGDTFYLSEFAFDDITTKYTKEGDKYFCEFAHYPERSVSGHPIDTPWGIPQTTTEIAPGIFAYTTASHGGYWLSSERVMTMPKCLREFVPFGGPQSGPGRWFEEDCDWSVVALAFPQFFPDDAISAALKTLEQYKPEIYANVVAMRAGGRQV